MSSLDAWVILAGIQLSYGVVTEYSSLRCRVNIKHFDHGFVCSFSTSGTKIILPLITSVDGPTSILG